MTALQTSEASCEPITVIDRVIVSPAGRQADLASLTDEDLERVARLDDRGKGRG